MNDKSSAYTLTKPPQSSASPYQPNPKPMKSFIKRTIDRIRRQPLLVKPVVMPSLPYGVVIVDQGNGKWCHGFDDPLQHKWYINGDRATCLVCHQIIEKRYRNGA